MERTEVDQLIKEASIFGAFGGELDRLWEELASERDDSGAPDLELQLTGHMVRAGYQMLDELVPAGPWGEREPDHWIGSVQTVKRVIENVVVLTDTVTVAAAFGLVLLEEAWERIPSLHCIRTPEQLSQLVAWEDRITGQAGRLLIRTPEELQEIYRQYADACEHSLGETHPNDPAPANPDEEPRGCLKAGSGRGDCLHFVGLPPVFNEDTTDPYGIPLGWCIVCWLQYQLRQVQGVSE